MTLDRKDYKSAIPQLESRLEQIEKLGKDVFNKFDDIAKKTQLDAAEAKKKAAALDYQMDTLQVIMEYALVTTGQTPSPSTTWSTTMPTLDRSTQGKTLWFRSVTYRNGIVVQRTEPQTVNLMDGVYSFVNTVAGNTGWTTINGSTITTGIISSADGSCYFDLTGNSFQMKDGATLAESDNALVWNGSSGTLYVKGDLALAKDGVEYLKAWLESGMGRVQLGNPNRYNIILDGNDIGFYWGSTKTASLTDEGFVMYTNGDETTMFTDDEVMLADGAVQIDQAGAYFDGAVYCSNIGQVQTKSGGTDYDTDYNISSGNTGVSRAIASITLGSGVWVICYRCRFNPGLADTSYTTSVNLYNESGNAAVHDNRKGSNVHQHNCSTIVSPMSQTTYYLNGTTSLQGDWVRGTAAALQIKAVRLV